MQRAFTYLIPALLLFTAHPAPAKTLYTWTDKDGVVHITESKPPAGIRPSDKITYTPRPKGETRKVDQSKKNQGNAMLKEHEAGKKAKIARRKAEKAKKAMAAAIHEADRMKAETDTYIRQWGYRARHRKSIKAKIDRKKSATNQAVTESQRLIEMATAAEAKAREAEKELNDLKQFSSESKAYTRNLESGTRKTTPPSE